MCSGVRRRCRLGGARLFATRIDLPQNMSEIGVNGASKIEMVGEIDVPDIEMSEIDMGNDVDVGRKDTEDTEVVMGKYDDVAEVNMRRMYVDVADVDVRGRQVEVTEIEVSRKDVDVTYIEVTYIDVTYIDVRMKVDVTHIDVRGRYIDVRERDVDVGERDIDMRERDIDVTEINVTDVDMESERGFAMNCASLGRRQKRICK